MNTTCVLDLETIGCTDEAVIAEIAESITPPANYKKQETIDAWTANEKPALVEQAILKTSFDGGLGRIVCIGWAVDDGEPFCLTGDEAGVIGDERAIIAGFFSSVGGYRQPVFVGHNISGFDLRFLWQRAVVHGIRPPSQIPFNVKPWDKAIVDTMTLWSPERDKRISLDKLCKVLGVKHPHTEPDGSQVFEFWKAGRIEEIAQHCKEDVEATRACFRKMSFA